MKSLTITVVIPTTWEKAKNHALVALKSVETALLQIQAAHRPKVRSVLFINQTPQTVDIKTLQSQWQTGLQFPLELLTGAVNLGFTGGVNEAIAWVLRPGFVSASSKADWVYVMNDDAVVLPNFWQTFLTELSKNQPAAVISGGVQTPQGRVESFGLRYERSGLAFPLTQLAHNWRSPKPTYFCGCYFFLQVSVARELWQKFGYVLQPLFFAYGEDLELSIRLQRLKQKILVLPILAVQHQGSATAKKGSEFQLFHGLRNLWWTSYLHWSWWDWLVRGPWVVLGHLYVVLLSCYKGYWWLYAKMWVSTYRHRLALQYVRHQYQKYF